MTMLSVFMVVLRFSVFMVVLRLSVFMVAAGLLQKGMFIGMAKLMESVPNFSEGRDRGVVEALAESAKSVPGAALLDYSADADHNRSVFTLLGAPESVAEAVFRMCGTARDRIDMNAHKGEHPRMGAADVVPFVPVGDCAIDECVEISKIVAKRIFDELGIPCFLYGESCSRESRRNLASIRKGGFDIMLGRIKISVAGIKYDAEDEAVLAPVGLFSRSICLATIFT
jgi:glutamate formiminotransferase